MAVQLFAICCDIKESIGKWRERQMQVNAAVARANCSEFSVECLSLDSPRHEEILVRVFGVGICHTDLVMKGGVTPETPAVFGHEGAGIVEEVGDAVTKVKPGDHVAISFLSCGTCAQCRAHHPAYCNVMALLNFSGARPDGSTSLRADDQLIASNFFGQSSFANYCLTYERNVVKISDDVPLEIVGPLGCGIQTGAGAVMCALSCDPGSSILVLGGGTVGLSAVMGAIVQGCSTIIVVEPHAARRTLASELGATHVIDPAVEIDLSAAIRAIAPEGVNYAVDTSGVPKVQSAAMASLAHRGILGLVAISPAGAPIPGNLMNLTTSGQCIKGIIEGDSDPDVFIPELIALYREGRFPFDRLVKTYPLREINQAVADQHSGACIKAILLPWD
jgi:aryl-alcohol dehydrogenase